MKKIAILGAGGWGTALAIAIGRSRQPHQVALWAHSPDVLAGICDRRENTVYLPGRRFPDETIVTGELSIALQNADLIIGAVPSAHARAVYAAALAYLASARSSYERTLPIFLSATKGLESGSHLRMSEVLADAAAQNLPDHTLRVAALSGPGFAPEVARGDPTALVVAAKDLGLAAEIQDELSGPTLRLYTNDDIVGVELGGAVKNVIAIAAGVCVGLGFGANTVAALVTRGLAEMTRLAVALGGRRDTLAGLAGLGDLVLTATGDLSRNRWVGVELGKGRPLREIVASMRMVAEGVDTAAATRELARAHGVEMPIIEQMHTVLNEGRAPRDAIRELMDRRLKQE